jgi:hypothetical protein
MPTSAGKKNRPKAWCNAPCSSQCEPMSSGWVAQCSSISFVACVGAYLNYANAPIMVFCEYPILDDEGQFAPDGSGTIELCLGGAPELFCKVRILPKGSMEFFQRFSVQTEANGASIQPTTPRNRWFTEYQVPGNSPLRIVVTSPQPISRAVDSNL